MLGFREEIPLFLASRSKVPEHNRNATIIMKYWCPCSGVEAVRSEQVEVRPPLPTLASLDEEFGDTHIKAAPKLGYQPSPRRQRYILLLLFAAVVSVTSAVIWPNNALQLWSFAQLVISSSAEQTTGRSSSGSPEPLIELAALKDEISELRNGQQKMRAEIALWSAQQELQLSSVKAMPWHSEPNALLDQPASSKPIVAAAHNTPSTRPRAATQQTNAEPRNRTVPLPLTRPQATASDGVSIK
jgi:hypothetical protein